MRVATALVVLLGLLPSRMPAQRYWAYGLGGLADDRVTAVAAGPDGSVFACGTFSGVMLYPGGSTISNGITDVFLMRLDTAGQVVWIRTGGGPGPDRATALAVDATGRVVITGQFSGSATFDTTPVSSNGPSQDVFVASYAPDGQVQWVRNAGSPENGDIGEEVAMDAQGRAYVAGEFSFTATFGGFTLTSTFDDQIQAPGSDVFLARYTADGNVDLVVQGAAPHADLALGLATTSSGGVALAGQFSGDISFGIPHPNQLNHAGFVVQFDETGQETWFHKVGGGGSVLVSALCAHADTLWMVGSQSGSNLVFGTPPAPMASSYPYSAFIVGFSDAGNVLAQRTLGSDRLIEGHAIDVRDGDILVGGVYDCQPNELAVLTGGDGRLLAWGPKNSWLATVRRADMSVTYGQAFNDRQPMELSGVALDAHRNIYAAGGYSEVLYCPAIYGTTRVLPGDSVFFFVPAAEGACGDTTYYDGIDLRSRGVSDGYLMKDFPRERAPVDLFLRHDPCTFALEDSLVVSIEPGEPCTLLGYASSLCGGAALSGGFAFENGPLTDQVVWSTGATTSTITTGQSGTFWASGSALDGCLQASDTISVGVCASPFEPGITDSEGVNDQDSLTLPVQVCVPELVTLTAGPTPGASFYWLGPQDTVITDTSFVVPFPGIWTLFVVADNGCVNNSQVPIIYTPNHPLGVTTADLSLDFPQDYDHNDTIRICDYERIHAVAHAQIQIDGSVLGANLPYMILDTIYVLPGGEIDDGSFDLAVDHKEVSGAYYSDGWYRFTEHITITDEPCFHHSASFVFSDSVYVIATAGAETHVDIVGPIFLCEGDTVQLNAVSMGEGHYHWVALNGGIIGPDTTQSILLTLPGYITLELVSSDTSVCAMNAYDDHVVQGVGVPTIAMDPPDGLICPGGTVELTVTGGTGSYTWYGPGGLLPFNTSQVQVSQAGMYYCVVHTLEGCDYATALENVSLFGTPYLSVFPQPVLCAGGSVEVHVQPDQNSIITWAPPLTGGSPVQVITVPGTYSCQVSQCGETTELAFTVTQSDPSVGIVDEGPFTICPLDSVLLQATPGLTSYYWMPGGLVGEQVQADVPGAYSVVGFDMYGCADTAGVAVVNGFAFSDPLTATADTVCAGADALGQAQGSGTFTWYDAPPPADVIGTGGSLSLPQLQQSTTVYVTQFEAPCTSLPAALVLPVQPLPSTPVITGDALLCAGEELLLTATGQDIQWSTPQGLVSGHQVQIAHASVNDGGAYSVTDHAHGCASLAASIQVAVDAAPTPALGPDVTICVGEHLQLNAGPGVTWAWNTGDTVQAISVGAAGTYAVLVTAAAGCSGTDTVLVDVGDCTIIVPNVITPNGDGHNDVIQVASPSDAPLSLIIYNRWGQVLFTRSAEVVTWNGRNGVDGDLVPEGVYYYVLNAVAADGRPIDQSGYIQLIR